MKNLLMAVLTALLINNAYAQKLPNKQENGMRLPANVKIDGKATEWNNQFQANNAATGLYYTMADNAEFVYFTALVKDFTVIDRMAQNGFTFEIYKNDSPQNKDFVSITVPFARNKYFNLNLIKPTGLDTLLEKSIPKNNNAVLYKHHKFLVVKGIQGLDSLSVYNNETGISFAEGFDSNNDYTIELQLPVKFVKLLPGDEFKFSYRLVINGLPDSGPSRGIATISPNGTITPINPRDVTAEMQAAVDELEARIAKKYGPTNFKADYTLTK